MVAGADYEEYRIEVLLVYRLLSAFPYLDPLTQAIVDTIDVAFYFTTGYEAVTEAVRTVNDAKSTLIVPKSDKTFRHVGKFDWSRYEATQPDERSKHALVFKLFAINNHR